MTAFDSNFLFLDNPRSGVEAYLPEIKAAGFQGVFCNVHAYSPSDWSTIRSRAILNNLFCGPWARIDPEGKEFDPLALHELIVIADDWAQPFIINVEKEVDNTGASCTTFIANAVGTRDAAISMEAWLFSAVDWKPVSHLPMLLQIFPAESEPAEDPTGCAKHARDLGIECVYFTFGTYGGMEPSDFNLEAPYSLFTADACGGFFQRWSPTSTGYDACQYKGKLMRAILDAWNHLYLSDAGKTWRASHSGEWAKARGYWRGEIKDPPTLATLFGQALVDIGTARRMAAKV